MDTITISRDVFDNPIFRSPERLRIWLALLFAADENGKVVISPRRFAQSIGTSYQRLRSALNAFTVTQLLTQQPTQQSTQITICNTAHYKGGQRSNQRKQQRSSQRTITPPKALSVSSAPPTFVAPEYAEAWNLWLDYRRETKRPYKSEKSERIGYEQFVKKSNNDPTQALEIVKNTIANGYQGLFSLKDNEREQKYKRNNPAVRGGNDRYAALERAAATILCGNDTCGNTNNGQG